QVANHADGDTLTFERGRVGVAKAVSVDALLDPRLGREARQQVANVALVDRASVEGAEDRGAAVDAPLAPDLQPAGNERRRARIEADHPWLSPLPCCTRTTPWSRSASLGLRANTSPMRSP